MGILSRFNPAPGVKDFWHEFSRPNPYRWPILGVSTLMTFTLLYAFTQERVIVQPAPPDVTYISTFAEGRTDEEIVASNIENQRRKEQLAAEQAERDERVREIYKSLGRATGLDVDAMEREAAEERAREEAAAAAATEQVRQPVAQAGE